MKQFEDAKTLVEHSRNQLSKLRILYDSSLDNKSVDQSLLIEVKNLCENLRSSLDILAVGINLKYCDHVDGKKIYFPYAEIESDASDFKKRLEKVFPGISIKRTDLHNYLIQIQHFESDGFKWLPAFMDLNNESKHQRIVPQIRKERKELHIKGTSGQVQLIMEEGALLELEPGAAADIGGAKLLGGQLVGVNNLPVIEGGSAEIVKWVSFHFESNNQAVLPFLSNAVAGIHQIVDKLSS
jgi:hypothetical protein